MMGWALELEVFFCLSQKSQLSCCDCYITMTCQWQGGSQALISQLVCSQFFLRQYSFFRSVFGAELQHMEQTCCDLLLFSGLAACRSVLGQDTKPPKCLQLLCMCQWLHFFFFFLTRVHGHLKWKVLCFPQ